MQDYREVCLFLTLRCNQQCRYCHRFLGIDEVGYEDNKRIIDKLTEDKIYNVTFTGGEPLLYPNILELLKYAKEKGIKSKIITNGEILAKNPKMREIYNYLDSITLSIDSIDNDINEKLGRGYNHFIKIKEVLDSLKNHKLKVNINTVVSKVNLNYLEELGDFLKEYNLNTWRIFKFAPLRETAKLNEKEFEISNVEFRTHKPIFASFPNINKIEFRENDDMESKYLLIMPNAEVIITENNEDVVIGNILENNISELLKNRVTTKKTSKIMEKIRTLISYNTETEIMPIINKIKELDYVDLIGVSANGIDTYNKIVNLKPEIVFAEYNLEGMSGLELVEKSKQKLNDEMPVFNFISDNIPEEQVEEIVNIAGNKVMQLIQKNQMADKIVNALREYNDIKQD